MTISLPHELENSLRAEVLSGHFATPDDAVAEIVRDYFRRKHAKPTSTTNLPEANGELGPDPVLGSMRDFADETDEFVADIYRRRSEETWREAAGPKLRPGIPEANGGLGMIGALRDDADLLEQAVEHAMKVREERPWRLPAGE